MDTIFQISALAVIAAVSCLLLKGKAGELSLVLSLAGVVAILSLALAFLSPILDVFRRLRSLSGLADEVTAPMLKVSGIGLLTQITVSVCDDAGETLISRVVSMSGTVLAIYASLPLISAVISLLEDTLL